MKKLLNWFLSLFKKTKSVPTPSKTPRPPRPTPSPTVNGEKKIHSFNVNGLEDDINKVCSTGVITIYSECSRLDFGCYVYSNPEGSEHESLVGKHFHDYMNDVVYQVQESGMIVNLGRCNP